MFRILSIDGGGVRGIFPAHFLDLFERHHTQLHETFDLIVGTSTGAILAAAAALRIPMSEAVRQYEDHVPRIFVRAGWLAGYFSSRYRSGPLRELLASLFGDTRMGAVTSRLLIPTTDISNGNVFVIKSSYQNSFVRDREIAVVDAVLASCAAPSYFDPVLVGEYLLADGGLWANNPSFVAYTEAVGKLGIPKGDVRILSVGTGTGHRCYDVGRAQPRWGLLTGWSGSQLVDTAMNIQGRASSNTAALLLGPQYLRISFDETGSLPLDDTSCMPRLKAKAGEAFTYRHGELVAFLGV